MNILDQTQSVLPFGPNLAKRFMRIGVVFAVLGAFSIMLPQWATLVDVLLIAWMLVFWGAAGLWFAWEMRPAREWRIAAGVFGAAFLLGLIFLGFLLFGITTLTILLGWPETAAWALGLLLGLNFPSTGRALVMLAKAGKAAV